MTANLRTTLPSIETATRTSVGTSANHLRSADIVFNIRTLSAPQSGVQRYARELDRLFPAQLPRVAPGQPKQGPAGHLWEQTSLPRLMKGRLLFSPGNTGPLLYKRQVITIHDASTFDYPDAFAGLFGRWYRWLLPRLARRAKRIITVSQFSKDRLEAALKIPSERITVVHNGVTPLSSEISADIARTLCRQIGITKRFILFVGSNDPRKNVQKLIDGFLKSSLNNVQLVIAGGDNRQLFAGGNLSAQSDKVLFVGRVSETVLDALYSEAEAFVFPSLYEGFGLPPLEAMSRGCPVLTSDASSLVEVCGPGLDDGGACLYFSPQSADSIATSLQAFTRLSEESRRHMISEGRARAATFSWERCAAKTLEVLAEC